MIIRRINEVSVAKIAGLLYAIIGLIAGLIFSLFSMLGAALGGADQTGGPIFGLIFGIGGVIFLPIMYGVMGFLFSLIGAWIYNMIAGQIGGIEIEVEEKPAYGQAPAPPSF